ncbi:MAG: hypothetical protein LCH26_07975 [Proteobacteria bacterium]|nr:hypothetical protein [Pseudomonadota bacterium]
MGCILNYLGKFEEACYYFEEFHKATSCDTRDLYHVFGLIVSHLNLGNTQEALVYCDEILEASAVRQQTLRDFSSDKFLGVALAYIMDNKQNKAEKFIALHNRLKPNVRPIVISHVVGKSSKEAKKLSATQMAQIIKQRIKDAVQERCVALAGKIENISFASFDDFHAQEGERAQLMKSLGTLRRELQRLDAGGSTPHAASSSSSDTTSTSVTHLTIQRDIDTLERVYGNLEKKHQEARKLSLKKMQLVYLESLGHDERELLPLEVSSNIRAQFGHEKIEAEPCLLAASSSSDPAPEAIVAPLHVTFTMLPHVRSDLEKLKQISGHEKKYEAFLGEIAADPTGLTGKSGRLKALVGEKGLFAYRFDKGNRLTYRAIQTGENDYHVTILSAFGHYKNLQAQIAQSRAQTSSSSTTPAQKAKPTRGVKGKAGKGKKRR